MIGDATGEAGGQLQHLILMILVLMILGLAEIKGGLRRRAGRVAMETSSSWFLGGDTSLNHVVSSPDDECNDWYLGFLYAITS